MAPRLIVVANRLPITLRKIEERWVSEALVAWRAP